MPVVTMKKLQNERGIALVTALLLTLIAFAITMAILYMVIWQTKLSGAHKRYKTALEASQGGVQLFTQQIIPQVFGNVSGASLASQFPAGLGLNEPNSSCFQFKLLNPTAKWGSCADLSDPYNATSKPDVTFKLQGAASTYTVYSKIVDTVPGNSDLSGYALLDSGAGVAGISSGIAPKHIPAMYRIEVQGQQATNPLEKARLSVLYAF